MDYFPSSCGAESLSTLLDEVSLLRHSASASGGQTLPMTEAVRNFRYFVVDNATIVAVLEEPLGSQDQASRGPEGICALLKLYTIHSNAIFDI